MSAFKTLCCILLLTVLVGINLAQGYELVIVQGISSTKRSFYLNIGRDHGIGEGQESTFTTDNISILARAITVSRSYSQWEMIEREALVPFSKGQIVTLNNTPENLWSFIPRPKIKEVLNSALIFEASYFMGLSESVSNSENSTESQNRYGFQLETHYDKEWKKHFHWMAGLRFDKEQNELRIITITSQRYYAIAGLAYYLNDLNILFDRSHFYAAISTGIGQASSTINESNVSGLSYIFPCTRLGLEVPMSDEHSLLFEGAYEVIVTKNKFDDGTAQDVNQANFKFTFGMKNYF